MNAVVARSALDTDTLPEILKRRDPTIAARAAACLSQHGQFAFSSITRYEVVRGLKARAAARQLGNSRRSAGIRSSCR